jgi:hypothetical protein
LRATTQSILIRKKERPSAAVAFAMPNNMLPCLLQLSLTRVDSTRG